MKIGIDCRLWDETGVGRYIRNLVLNLQKIDKENEYILFVLKKDKEKILKQVQNDKFKIIEADIKWHTINEQLRFPKILNRENLDLMHFPYFSVPIFYNKPYVFTIHDLIPHHFSTGQASTLPPLIYNLKLLAYKFVLNQSARKAKKIIAVSNATKQEIVDHLKINPDRVTVTCEGVDDKILNSKLQIPNKFQISNSKFQNTKYFLYVGNAYPHKNLERLLEAFKLLHSNASLVLVGKEDYFYKRLKEKVQDLNLSDKIVFLQNVSDEELSNLYQNALALIMPSLMEGFGLPALEAMANKCLVLASDIPALRELCDDAAVYFDPYSVESIKEKMREVCFNDLPRRPLRSHRPASPRGEREACREASKAGLNHFSEKIKSGLERVRLFSWRKMAKETLKVYNSLAL